jgi:uncharacterized protein YbjT (DUF2867 family)
MKVLVMGSTGGSGRAAVAHLLAQGHEVTAFTRQARSFQRADRLRVLCGDAMNASHVESAIAGHQAVVVTLGISENPLRVRLFGPAHTPIDVRSVGTRHVITAMRKHGLRRLVVQTSFGIGPTRGRLGVADRMFFELILKPQIADTEEQERAVRESDRDWVIVQPVHLTDAAEASPPFVSSAGETGAMKVSRTSVGRVLAEAVTNPACVRQSLAVSGPVGQSGRRPAPAHLAASSHAGIGQPCPNR